MPVWSTFSPPDVQRRDRPSCGEAQARATATVAVVDRVATCSRFSDDRRARDRRRPERARRAGGSTACSPRSPRRKPRSPRRSPRLPLVWGNPSPRAPRRRSSSRTQSREVDAPSARSTRAVLRSSPVDVNTNGRRQRRPKRSRSARRRPWRPAALQERRAVGGVGVVADEYCLDLDIFDVDSDLDELIAVRAARASPPGDIRASASRQRPLVPLRRLGVARLESASLRRSALAERRRGHRLRRRRGRHRVASAHRRPATFPRRRPRSPRSALHAGRLAKQSALSPSGRRL